MLIYCIKKPDSITTQVISCFTHVAGLFILHKDDFVQSGERACQSSILHCLVTHSVVGSGAVPHVKTWLWILFHISLPPAHVKFTKIVGTLGDISQLDMLPGLLVIFVVLIEGTKQRIYWRNKARAILQLKNWWQLCIKTTTKLSIDSLLNKQQENSFLVQRHMGESLKHACLDVLLLGWLAAAGNLYTTT